MNKYINISNTELSNLIDEWIKSDRNRRILKRRLIDGIALEPLSEEFDLTVDRIKQILRKEGSIVEDHIPYMCQPEWVTLLP